MVRLAISASRFREVIAFVISQDGDLRIFAGDEDHGYFANYIHP
jgi:hypothetical protein